MKNKHIITLFLIIAVFIISLIYVNCGFTGYTDKQGQIEILGDNATLDKLSLVTLSGTRIIPKNLTYDIGTSTIDLYSGTTTAVQICLTGDSCITTWPTGGSFTGTLNDISDVATTTTSYGDLLMWNGTAWTNNATSTLGISGGTGLITLSNVVSNFSNCYGSDYLGADGVCYSMAYRGNGANLKYRSIDTMKYQKDYVRNQFNDEYIKRLVKFIANNFNLTHIAIAIPINSDADFTNAGVAAPAPNTLDYYTEVWADAIHNEGLGILWRGTLCEVEGLYDFTKADGADRIATGTVASAPTDATSTLLGKIYTYINDNPDYFKDGDIWAPLPERTEGIFQDSTSFLPYDAPDIQTTYNLFFQDLHTVSEAVFTANNLDIITGFTANNYSEVASGWIPAAVFTDAGIVAFDHYGESPYGVATMQANYDTIYAAKSLPIFHQEWSDYWNDDSATSTRISYLESMYSMMSSYATTGVLQGFNYWGGWTTDAGSNESIFINTNASSTYPIFALKYNGKILQDFLGIPNNNTDLTLYETQAQASSSFPTFTYASSTYATTSHSHSTFQTLDGDLTSIAGLTGTKGDLITWGTAWTDLAVGTDNYVLVASSTATNGIAWQATSTLGFGSGSSGGWDNLNDMTLADGQIYVGDGSNNPAASNEIFLDSSSMVGINQTDPDYTLDVINNDSSNNNPTMRLGSGSANRIAGIHFANSTEAYIGHIGCGDTSAPWGLDNKCYFGTITDLPMLFTQYDSEVMRLTTDNTVAIGTSTGYAALTIWGDDAQLFEVANNASTTFFRIDSNGKTTMVNGSSTVLTVSGTSYLAQVSLTGTMSLGTGATINAGSGNLEIPNNSACNLKGVTGRICLDTTNDELQMFGGSATTTIPTNFYPAFTSPATTTDWTGTSTWAAGTAFIDETWNAIQCFTDAGTLDIQIGDGTNWMNLLKGASTTVSTFTFSTNNTFTALEKRYFRAGNPETSPTYFSCTVSKKYNPN